MLRIALFSILAFLASNAVADSWRKAEPIAAVSENAEWLVRVEPGDSIGDVYGFSGAPKGEYATATLFKFDEDIQRYVKVTTYRTHNPVSPVDILVANDGWLIAVDNWHNFGIGVVVASYDEEGVLVLKLSLTDIFDPEELENFDRSVSSVWWRCGPAAIDTFETQFSVWDTLGRTILINYVDGSVNVVNEAGFCLNDED